MRHIKFPSIEQFRHTVKEVNYHARKRGEVPGIIRFHGTVKLHGSNGGVSVAFNSNGEIGDMWYQSREQFVTIDKDNAGFAFFCEARKADLATEILKASIINSDLLKSKFPDGYILTMYFEWCGGSIQKGVALSQLEKMAVIIGLKASPLVKPDVENGDESSHAIWLDHAGYGAPEKRIFNVLDFETYGLDIDFSQPELAQNKLVEITEKVEAECPVGRYFGVSGVGEGVVWSARIGDSIHRFKVKGEKHSNSKVTKLASVNVEKVNSINEFVNGVVTPARLQQAMDNVFGIGGEPDIKRMGELIRWVNADVCKEEMDTMVASGIDNKDVGKPIRNVVVKWFMENHA